MIWMKRTVKECICMVCMIAVCFCFAPCAFGAEQEKQAFDTLQEALPSDTQKIFSELDIEGSTGFESGIAAILEYGQNQVKDLIKQILGHGAALLFVVLLCDGAQLLYFKEKDSLILQCATITGALSIVLLSAGSISDMIGLGVETIYTMNDFSKALLPLLGTACAATGCVTSAAVREITTALFADVLITIISMLLIPLIHIYIGAITANAVLKQNSLKNIAKWIKKAITWFLTILLTAFTAYLTISGVISGSADATALKVTKAAISGAIPVVGSIMSDAASTILAGAGILKNTVGIFGMLAIFALCITPFLQIGLQYLMYKVTAFLAETIDQTGLSSLMNDIGGAFGMVLGMTGACALLLVISIITSISAVIPT